MSHVIVFLCYSSYENTVSTVSSALEYQAELKAHLDVEFSEDLLFESASFSASVDFQAKYKHGESNTDVRIFVHSSCTAYTGVCSMRAVFQFKQM